MPDEGPSFSKEFVAWFAVVLFAGAAYSQAFVNYWFLVAGLMLVFIKHADLKASQSNLSPVRFSRTGMKASS